DPVRGGLLLLVGLAGSDHLSVGGDEVEVVLAARALLHHELAAPRKRPLSAWSGRGGGVDSRHITDLRHDHACFIPILATPIGDMPPMITEFPTSVGRNTSG